MRMMFVLTALVAAAGCGTDEALDPSLATADYVVPAILAPSCATAACHSSQTGREGLQLGTIEDACAAYGDKGPLTPWLTGEGVDGVRMPLDAPLPDADIALLELWYFEGGEPRVQLAGCP